MYIIMTIYTLGYKSTPPPPKKRKKHLHISITHNHYSKIKLYEYNLHTGPTVTGIRKYLGF